ncbi:MAG TPA: PfkB family carbohydrate kinase [Solirubrobacteraceae bacterium]|jgi:fructokinase|nr:PfkB family carbohydrate kinase [Solirubrobacteraceae bacterium]
MRTLLLGEALVDLICERPVAHMKEADAFVPHFGGAVANVAVAAARRGARVALAGGAGDDPWGAWLRDRLAAEGVDLDWFDLLPGVLTPVAFVTVDLSGEPSYAIYGDTIEAVVEALDERLDDAVDRCDALFVTSNTLVGKRERALTVRARDRALEHGKPVLFDPNLRLHRWAEPAQAASEARALVKGAFLVKCNGEEARLLTGEDEAAAAAEGLLAAGAQHAIVTRGAHGAVLRGGGMRLDVPGVPAHPISTVGAGDAFMGTVVAGLAATRFYPAAIAAALRDAVAEGARATERWSALG